MKKATLILIILHVFVGIGAAAAGLLTIMNPYEPLGMSVEYLENSPFSNYLIPGIILFAMNGIGNLLSALSLIVKFKYRGYVSGVFGWGLAIWIIVQCIMINVVAALHIIFFLIGAIEASLAMSILFHQRQFPANIIRKMLKV